MLSTRSTFDNSELKLELSTCSIPLKLVANFGERFAESLYFNGKYIASFFNVLLYCSPIFPICFIKCSPSRTKLFKQYGHKDSFYQVLSLFVFRKVFVNHRHWLLMHHHLLTNDVYLSDARQGWQVLPHSPPLDIQSSSSDFDWNKIYKNFQKDKNKFPLPILDSF